ncbi:MAG: hypothetical protein Q4F18_00635 [Clostridia bacterium]|nr:hypothetical protein [Clostridia bacterium]
MKKYFSIALLLTLLMTLVCVSALADDVPPASEISENPNCAETEWYNPLRDDDFKINYVSSGISKESSTSIKATATTETNQKASDIGGTITVQRWKDNKWNKYYTIGFYGYNTSSYSVSKSVTVESGYYYRLSVYHSASITGSSSAVTSTTKSVYVN